MRRFPGKVHIGDADFSVSMSMCAQNEPGACDTSAGNHGTSTSTSRPTSAFGRCLFGE
jgi:hypothetical protein